MRDRVFHFGCQTTKAVINGASTTHLARTEDYFRGVVNVAESYVACGRAHK